MFNLGCTSDKIWNQTELIAYLAQNQNKDIDIQLFPEAICLETIGLYKILDCFEFNNVTIRTYNPFEISKKYNISFLENFWFTLQPEIDCNLHTWNQTKKFFCFYHRPTASRLGIASHVLEYWANFSHIHFSSTVDNDDELIQFELDKLLSYQPTSIENAGKLIKCLPLLLSPSHRYRFSNGYNYADKLTNFYKDILIDIVVESHVLGKTFFPTEKTLRPMWLKKPFVLFGSKNFLLYLRQMGFKTFGDYWDEDYDGYDGPQRYKKILQLLDTLANKSYKELEEIYADSQSLLTHNFELLKKQTYTTNLTYVD